jgi:ubiquinone/menaquinone biosynthesis C-methylase UbiE
VVASAESLPFEDGSFDVVVSRIAPHHFSDIRGAVAEMARVTRDAVVVEDTLFTSDDVELAEKLRDPSHVRNQTEAAWLQLLDDAGLVVEHVEEFRKTHVVADWLERTGCTGETADRVRSLLAAVTSADGETWQDTKIILEAKKKV